MNDLNKQYFESKEIHKKNVKKNAWITWSIILLLTVAWIIQDVYRTFKKEELISEKSIENKIEDFYLALNDTVIYSNQTDFKILIKSGLYFGSINDEMPIMVISNDSTDLVLFIKRTKTDIKYDSLIEQWESKITQTDSTYRFFDIERKTENNIRKETGTVELTKNNKKFMGEILVVENGIDIFIVQGITNRTSWNFKKTDIQTMIRSFEIK